MKLLGWKELRRAPWTDIGLPIINPNNSAFAVSLDDGTGMIFYSIQEYSQVSKNVWDGYIGVYHVDREMNVLDEFTMLAAKEHDGDLSVWAAHTTGTKALVFINNTSQWGHDPLGRQINTWVFNAGPGGIEVIYEGSTDLRDSPYFNDMATVQQYYDPSMDAVVNTSYDAQSYVDEDGRTIYYPGLKLFGEDGNVVRRVGLGVENSRAEFVSTGRGEHGWYSGSDRGEYVYLRAGSEVSVHFADIESDEAVIHRSWTYGSDIDIRPEWTDDASPVYVESLFGGYDGIVPIASFINTTEAGMNRYLIRLDTDEQIATMRPYDEQGKTYVTHHWNWQRTTQTRRGHLIFSEHGVDEPRVSPYYDKGVEFVYVSNDAETIEQVTINFLREYDNWGVGTADYNPHSGLVYAAKADWDETAQTSADYETVLLAGCLYVEPPTGKLSIYDQETTWHPVGRELPWFGLGRLKVYNAGTWWKEMMPHDVKKPWHPMRMWDGEKWTLQARMVPEE